MKIIETGLSDCYILEPTIFEDDRGYFYESFNETLFHQLTGLDTIFVQDNQSFSNYGVIRALHAQRGEFAQAKLVRVLSGKVLDVAVDARRGSSTFGQHIAVELSAANQRQLFLPKGFLHGFSVLSETATFFYKCDAYYNKSAEYGVRFDDPHLAIDWKIGVADRIVSQRDLEMSSWLDFIKQIDE